jgi:radical SAM protein (TIGR01212 family)
MNFQGKERPFYTVNDFYQQHFGQKVFKVSLNGNFTCPNKDGTLSTQGCLYCSESGSGDFAGNPKDDLQTQFNNIFQTMKQKWPTGKAIAYFQANTNTYAPLPILKELFESALSLSPDIVGLAIATRPDCLGEEIVDYLKELSYKTSLFVELGLQTIHEKTASWLNRGHDLNCFDDAIKRLSGSKIYVVAHIINGLPYESKDDMLATIQHLNTLDIHGVKIHMLHIMKHTVMAQDYLSTPFPILSLVEYADIVASQIAILRKDIVVYRVTGDAPKELLIEPVWSLKKFVVQNEIDKLLRSRSHYQGVHYYD